MRWQIGWQGFLFAIVVFMGGLFLGSVEFVVQRSDTVGGPGANFLIRWKGPPNVDEPVIEAVMLGQSANAGISFTSTGRAVKSRPGDQ